MKNKNFDHIPSVYWVFTQVCNDKCDHCYNLSGPAGSKITIEDCKSIIDNLPIKVDRLILSGGEPMAERKKLYFILDKIKEKYKDKTQVMLQTNGDLLNKQRMDELIQRGVSRFDIASIDRYHKHKGEKLEELRKLFQSRGVKDDVPEPLVKKDNFLITNKLSWGYWGATEDMWLGGNWARGRAMEKDLWLKNPKHNFCKVLSGGIGFLNGTDDIPQEISIQLYKVNPCCPGTKKMLGDARQEKIADILMRVSQDRTFQAIDRGEPLEMGVHLGVSKEEATKRCNQLKNICLWCDEFFAKHHVSETLKNE